MIRRQFDLSGVLKIILALLLLLLFIGSSAGYAFENSADWLDLAENDQIEILILLKDQADTERAASRARLVSFFFRDPDLRKNMVRSAVTETLRDNASAKQESLISFLEQERLTTGLVYEYESFYIVNMIFARISKCLLGEIAERPEVESIWPNEEIELLSSQTLFLQSAEADLLWNISHIGADRVWDILKVDGSGVVIGIIDTGVDWQHESLQVQYRGYNPDDPADADHRYNWYDPYNNSLQPGDNHGHGTAVASIAVGSDSQKLNQIGVAPGAKWIAAKGLDDNGAGTYAFLLAAMEYMLAPTPNADGSGSPDPNMAPDIVNNSWGGSAFCNPIFKEAIQNWRNAGILPVFSAGNNGPAAGSIRLPGNYEESFAVGAIGPANELPSFSGRGPGACGDFIKPDLCAPGVGIRVAQAGGGYLYGTGTSMAAPHVTGAAALLRSADPSISVEQMEMLMRETTIPLTNANYPNAPNYGFGHGLLDAYAAASSIVEETYTVILTADPPDGGTVSGEGIYPAGTELTVSAEPHQGYSFKNWTENGLIRSDQLEYTFTVKSDRDLVANFDASSYSIDLLVDPQEGGSVTGGGSYGHSDLVTVTAKSNRSYRFSGWFENDHLVNSSHSFSFNAEKERTLTARFQTIDAASITPRLIYYTNAGGFLVRADYRQAVEEALSGSFGYLGAIKNVIIEARLQDRAIYVEDVNGNVTDYRMALDDGQKYFEAAFNPATYGVELSSPDLELIFNSESEQYEESQI